MSEKYCNFATNLKQNAMQSVEDKILTSLKKSGRGVAFAPVRFAHLGTVSAVQKAIERLANDGLIIRASRGIYF